MDARSSKQSAATQLTNGPALFRRYLVSVRGGELELQPSTKS